MPLSKPKVFLSNAIFSSLPAMPTTLQPLILAICPTMLPTAPDAPDTKTVSPSFGSPIFSNPIYAVIPVRPKIPK